MRVNWAGLGCKVAHIGSEAVGLLMPAADHPCGAKEGH